MDDNIITLAHRTHIPTPAQHIAQPVPEIIEKLEEVLADAKSGEVQAFAIAIWTKDDCGKSAFHAGDHYFSMLGVIAWLQTRLHKALDDQ